MTTGTYEIPGIGNPKRPKHEGAYARRCATKQCKGLPFKAGYCVNCGPTAAIMKLLKALEAGAVLRARKEKIRTYVVLEPPDGEPPQCVKEVTLKAAVKRKLLVSMEGSPGRYGFRLSNKATQILEAR